MPLESKKHIHICENCKTFDYDYYYFCIKCGNKMIHYLSCGHFIYTNIQYCPDCGERVPEYIRKIAEVF
jgi:hypothetical protein